MKTILILIPVFNDWESAGRLVSEIDLLHTEDCFSILFVDDASVKPVNISVPDKDFRRISDISVLSLNRNLGHQRAIASGLAYAYHNSDFKAVIVMDSDGEDRPDDIPALIKAFRESDRNKIIFAERNKRSESMQFKIFYQLYLITFRILTGFVDRMGNFSIVPRSLAKRLVTASEIWMHYSSSVRKLQIPYEKVMADRGLRYHGKSKMRLTGHLLEVGAGIGGNTSMFARLHLHGITCLEPDSKLAEGLRKKLHADGLAEKCRVIIGNTGTMTDEKVYDTVVYIDVMEHIENDTEEMHRAACLLNSGGHLIVLSPAHNILYSPFDKAVGHFRRYNREMLAAIVPEENELFNSSPLRSQ
ncbi:MAG: glycosyltransferase [Desulfobacteraceae bacterium]|nr:glycosyltransferase [Desulfobacteraceae bacterium]